MNELFVDTIHLVALVNPRDQWHQKAVEVETATRNIDLVTTEDILTEFLNFYSEHGEFMRMQVSSFVREILLDVRVKIIPHLSAKFCLMCASKSFRATEQPFLTHSNFTNRASTKVIV